MSVPQIESAPAVQPVRRTSVPAWVAEERDDIVMDSLIAMKVALEEHPSDIVIPNDLVFAVIVALSDLRIRQCLNPEVLALVRSWVESLPGLDRDELRRIDRLIVHGEGGLVG